MIPEHNAVNFLVQCKLAEEYTRFLQEEFVEVMRQRGHRIIVQGDEIRVEEI